MAIAIPVFTTQLERSREATDMSNIRAAYAEVVAEYLSTGATSGSTATVSARQRQASWQNPENGTLYTRVNGSEGSVPVSAKTNGQIYSVIIDASGNVSVG